MRKLIVSMNVTLDGFLSGPNCELDWHFRCWNEEMATSLSEQLSEADTILLGRVTYKAMAAYWQNRMQDIHTPVCDIDFADMMNSYTKVVFSRTPIAVSGWNNTTLAKGSVAKVVSELKNQPGRHIMIYGSAKIVAELIRLQVIDEFRIWLHPVALGKGKALFNTVPEAVGLQLKKTVPFKSGVVLLYYTNRKVKNT